MIAEMIIVIQVPVFLVPHARIAARPSVSIEALVSIFGKLVPAKGRPDAVAKTTPKGSGEAGKCGPGNADYQDQPRSSHIRTRYEQDDCGEGHKHESAFAPSWRGRNVGNAPTGAACPIDEIREHRFDLQAVGMESWAAPGSRHLPPFVPRPSKFHLLASRRAGPGSIPDNSRSAEEFLR